MPRFHFNTANGAVLWDEEGSECQDIDQVRLEAVRLFCGLVRDDPMLALKHEDFRVEVSDPAGLIVFSVQLLTFTAPTAREDSRSP